MNRFTLVVGYAMAFAAFIYCLTEAIIGEPPTWRSLAISFFMGVLVGLMNTRGAR